MYPSASGCPLSQELSFHSGFSEMGHIQIAVQLIRGEQVSDALILSNAQKVLFPIRREGQRWSKAEEALLVLRGGFGGGERGVQRGRGGDRDR